MGDKLKNYGIVDKLNIKIIHNIINPALSNYFNEMLDKNMFLDYYNRLVSFGMENEVISLDTSDIFDKTGIYAIDITNLNVDEGNNIYFDIISIHATYQLIDFICSYEIEDKNFIFLDLSDDTILLNFWSDVIVGYAYEFFIDKDISLEPYKKLFYLNFFGFHYKINFKNHYVNLISKSNTITKDLYRELLSLNIKSKDINNNMYLNYSIDAYDNNKDEIDDLIYILKSNNRLHHEKLYVRVFIEDLNSNKCAYIYNQLNKIKIADDINIDLYTHKLYDNHVILNKYIKLFNTITKKKVNVTYA